MAEPISSAAAGGSALAGGAIGAWLMRLLVGRELRRNDELHQSHTQRLAEHDKAIASLDKDKVGESTMETRVSAIWDRIDERFAQSEKLITAQIQALRAELKPTRKR